MKVFYNSDYTSSSYAFDTTRKAAAVANHLWQINNENVQIEDPSPSYGVTELTINRVHDRNYVKSVKTGDPRSLAESNGFDWDENIYPMTLAHSAGLVSAVDAVFSGDHVAGSLSSGLHHASQKMGAGFCTFNGLAVAAQHAYDLGARNIVCLDFDAHCGGGTYSMTRNINMTQIDVYVSSFDLYEPNYYDEDSLLIEAHGETDYLMAIDRALQHASSVDCDFVIYNAGMDPYNLNIRPEILKRRERMVADWSRGRRLIFALAGGYTWGKVTMDELVDLHSATVTSFANNCLNVSL